MFEFTFRQPHTIKTIHDLGHDHPSISLAPDGALTVEKRARGIYKSTIYYKAASSGVASETKQRSEAHEHEEHLRDIDE